jgi:hypothetical protein
MEAFPDLSSSWLVTETLLMELENSTDENRRK